MTFKRSGIRLWLLAFIGFWLLFAGWAFAAPYNGPPDEQEHALRGAGIMHGELIAQWDPLRDWHTAQKSLIRGWCFPTKVNVPASCETEPGGDETDQRVQTTAARYNPVYFMVTTWPLKFWPNWHGIMLSRLLNGAAMAAMLAAAVVAATRWTRHKAVLAGLIIAVTPMIAHLGGAINPNGIEIAAGVALFAALIALVHEQREGINRATVALAGISASVLVTPRFTGVMWLLVILGAILLPSPTPRLKELVRSRTVWIWSGVVALSTLAAFAWTVIAKTTQAVTWNRGYSQKGILREMLIDEWPNLANQMVGVMGWAETLMPRLVYVAWFAAVGLVILGALAMGKLVDRWRLLALFAATFLPLIALEFLQANQVGWFLQGRYFLTGAVGLPMIGAFILARRGLTGREVRSMTRLLAILLIPLHLVCLAFTIARWRSGLVSISPFNGSWTPPYGVVLPLLCGTLAVVVLIIAFWRAARADVPAPPGKASAAGDEEDPATVDLPAEPVGASRG